MGYDLSRKLFSIGTESFTCAGFLEALKFYGVFEKWTASVVSGLQCQRYAIEEKFSPDMAVVQKWSSEFRYEMNLLTADEFSSWLLQVDMNLEDFENYLSRKFWRERFSEKIGQTEFGSADFTEREIFAEIYFSSSFKSLLQSWQKRLLAWHDAKKSSFPGLTELEANFSQYNSEVQQLLNTQQWLKVRERELTTVSIECLVCDNDGVSLFAELSDSESLDEKIEKLNLESFMVREFYYDLPSEIAHALGASFKKGLVGPVEFDGEILILRIHEYLKPDLENEEVQELLFEDFSAEVWETLMVKYVKN